MNLKKASGLISNLQIVHTKQSILYGPQMKEASGISALAFALAGMSGAAVQTSMNSDGGAEDIDMYSFDIDGVGYAGCTRRISLKNGDEVELVYEARTEGREAIAVRRSGTRSIWLYPYMSRGTIAGKRHAIRLLFISSTGLTLFLLPIIMVSMALSAGLNQEMFRLLGVIALASMLGTPILLGVAVSWMLPRLLRFCRAADEVFAAFDYPHPKMVDLHKTSKAYRKAHDISWSAKNNFELWY